jgi:Tol biopolymer transport system component
MNKAKKLMFSIFKIFFFIFFGCSVAYVSAQDIVYDSNASGSFDIWVMNSDGTGRENLSIKSHDPNGEFKEQEPRWSPGGNKVAFRSNKSGCMNIWIMDADGSNDYNLTNINLFEIGAFWSSDGARLYFSRNTKYSGWGCGACPYFEIYVHDLITHNETRLTFNSYREMNPVVSPDGYYIAYTKAENPNDCCNPTDVWLMNADGSDQHLLLGDSDGKYEWSYGWGMYNNQILIAKHCDCASSICHEVVHVRPDGSNYTRLTYNNFQDYPFGFSPDEQRILIYSEKDGHPDIWIIDIWGNYLLNLTNDSAKEYGADWKSMLSVEIDIKPGSDPNSINLGSNGNVPVAIFSSEIFNATTVDPLSVTLAGASVRIKGKGTPQASSADVDGDGLLDLIVHVDTTALQLSSGDTEAILEGQTYDGVSIRGVDTVRIVQE